MVELGVVHGRFQLFHKDHLKYVLAAKEKCRHLIIGICNPDVRLTAFSDANPHRSALRENPFTFYERYQMIQTALIEAGMEEKDFDIVPFPINYPELIPCYVPMEARFFMTIYDRWGREKERMLRGIGCDVEVLWEVELSDKGISGSAIRERIRNGEDWLEFVPASVYRYILERKLDKRLLETETADVPKERV